MLKRFRFLWTSLLLVAAITSPAFAHTTSVTHIDVKVEADTITATLSLHQSDVLLHALDRRDAHERFADRQEFEDEAPKILAYVLDHFSISADGRNLPLAASAWPPQLGAFTQADATGIERPILIPMELKCALPPGNSRKGVSSTSTPSGASGGGRHVEIRSQLFSTVSAAIFDVTIYVGDAKPVTVVADSHQPVGFEVPTATPVAPGGVSGAAAEEEASPGFVATFCRFVTMGFYHIVPNGLDHILFVLGLYFLSPKLKDLFWQVTAFTIAHSITLGLAAFNIFTLPGKFVEPMIALSITAVAVENLFSRNKPVRPWRWVLVFCFGLIHGMGFADILHETHLPAGEALTAILSFNLGVEGGQFTVLLGALLLTGWWQKRKWYFSYIAAPASVLIACIGAFWTVQRILGA